MKDPATRDSESEEDEMPLLARPSRCAQPLNPKPVTPNP